MNNGDLNYGNLNPGNCTNRLYSELENSDVNHRRLQQVHILMIDKLIDSHRKRLEGLHNNYIKYLMLIKIGEFNEMSEAKRELIYSCKHLETVIYTENYLINDKLVETMTRNAINTYNIEFTKIKDIDEIRKTTGENISKLWFKLKQTIANYQNKTKTLREQYENLKKFDQQHKNETINFPQLENFLTSTIDILKNQENLLTETRNKNIKDLEIKIEIFNSRVLKLRDKSSVDKITDNIQLKKLSVISGKVIDDLKKIEEKSRTVTLLINLCLNIEPFLIGKCIKPINPEETDDDDDDDDDNNNTDKEFNLVTKDQSIIAPYHLLDNFWKAFNYVKAENYIRKKQLSKAIAENNKLKRYIKSYFGAVTQATAKLTD
ncbi:dynein regulatory complex subunit 2 isoform X2 [Cotesia typhae]|uniref:dynein regulatory complex subunit 2 isoform X2 n=1 Tax=Cotesia typhae TaxID=2053667 RepID=UPI003D686A99